MSPDSHCWYMFPEVTISNCDRCCFDGTLMVWTTDGMGKWIRMRITRICRIRLRIILEPGASIRVLATRSQILEQGAQVRILALRIRILESGTRIGIFTPYNGTGLSNSLRTDCSGSRFRWALLWTVTIGIPERL